MVTSYRLGDIMRGIVVLTVASVLIGCANVQSVKEAKDEQAYREQVLKMPKGNDRDELLLETVEERSYYEEVLRCEHYMKKINEGTPEEELVFDANGCQLEEVQRVRATPIEMPQEWLNQWPSLKDPNYVEPEQVEITDPCKQLGPAYCD